MRVADSARAMIPFRSGSCTGSHVVPSQFESRQCFGVPNFRLLLLKIPPPGKLPGPYHPEIPRVNGSFAYRAILCGAIRRSRTRSRIGDGSPTQPLLCSLLGTMEASQSFPRGGRFSVGNHTSQVAERDRQSLTESAFESWSRTGWVAVSTASAYPWVRKSGPSDSNTCSIWTRGMTR